MRKAIWKASACRPAPRRAANTCSRTRPMTRDTAVRSEMGPAARAIPRPVGLTSALKTGKLPFCLGEQEEWIGTSRVGPEADEAERQEPGSQPEERLPGQDPGEEAPRRHRRRGCRHR